MSWRSSIPFISRRQRTTVRLPLDRNSATSERHASARANDRYRGNANDRRYEGAKVVAISICENLRALSACTELKLVTYGGGSKAEKAGVRVLMVQALSELGSCWVVRASYAYENKNVSKIR